MFLVYIDDVKEGGAYFSGLMIPAARWRECWLAWRTTLTDLHERRGFRTTRELHATKLLSGHGQYFAEKPSLGACVATHFDVLRTIAAFPEARLFLACGPLALQERVFERLITRVNRTMEVENTHAMLVCDEGKTYDDLLENRRERNRIYLRGEIVDAPLTRIVDDIVYRKSAKSFMVQAADACVYTLFRREDPLERLETEGFAAAFDILDPIRFRRASPRDPDGIIRC